MCHMRCVSHLVRYLVSLSKMCHIGVRSMQLAGISKTLGNAAASSKVTRMEVGCGLLPCAVDFALRSVDLGAGIFKSGEHMTLKVYSCALDGWKCGGPRLHRACLMERILGNRIDNPRVAVHCGF